MVARIFHGMPGDQASAATSSSSRALTMGARFFGDSLIFWEHGRLEIWLSSPRHPKSSSHAWVRISVKGTPRGQGLFRWVCLVLFTMPWKFSRPNNIWLVFYSWSKDSRSNPRSKAWSLKRNNYRLKKKPPCFLVVIIEEEIQFSNTRSFRLLFFVVGNEPVEVTPCQVGTSSPKWPDFRNVISNIFIC